MPARTNQVAPGVPVPLQGMVTFSNTTPTIQWKLYSGPGTVTFGNAAQTNTTATFARRRLHADAERGRWYSCGGLRRGCLQRGSRPPAQCGSGGNNLNLSWRAARHRLWWSRLEFIARIVERYATTGVQTPAC